MPFVQNNFWGKIFRSAAERPSTAHTDDITPPTTLMCLISYLLGSRFDRFRKSEIANLQVTILIQ